MLSWPRAVGMADALALVMTANCNVDVKASAMRALAASKIAFLAATAAGNVDQAAQAAWETFCGETMLRMWGQK